MIGQHLHTQQLQTLCIRLDILEGHEGQVQCVHMGHHAHCESCHTEAFAVPVLDDLRVSQAPLHVAFLGILYKCEHNQEAEALAVPVLDDLHVSQPPLQGTSCSFQPQNVYFNPEVCILQCRLNSKTHEETKIHSYIGDMFLALLNAKHLFFLPEIPFCKHGTKHNQKAEASALSLSDDLRISHHWRLIEK